MAIHRRGVAGNHQSSATGEWPILASGEESPGGKLCSGDENTPNPRPVHPSKIRSIGLKATPKPPDHGLVAKGKPAARRGRKARGLPQTAQPPTSIERRS